MWRDRTEYQESMREQEERTGACVTWGERPDRVSGEHERAVRRQKTDESDSARDTGRHHIPR